MIFNLIIAFAVGSLPFGKFAKEIQDKITIKTKKKSNTYLLIEPYITLFVSLLDIVKIYLVVIISFNYLQNYLLSYTLALFAIVGDCYSPFLKFDGNKGIAATIGFIIAVHPISLIYLFVLYVIVLSINKYPNVTNVITFISFPIILIITKSGVNVILFTLLAAIIITVRHLDNIKNYLEGNEITLKEWFDKRNK